MRFPVIALASLLFAGAALPHTALAQDDPEPEAGGRARRQVREVVRGFHTKANVGYFVWLHGWGSPFTSGGSIVKFNMGYDVLDRNPGFTLTIEGSFHAALNDGLNSDDVADFGIANESPVQGDFQSFGGVVAIRPAINFGGQTIKRGSFFFKVGGGVFFSPLQREPGDFNAGLIHGTPAGLINAGLGIEYFTKLSHFSIGLEVDYMMVVGTLAGVGGGLGASGFVKYTF